MHVKIRGMSPREPIPLEPIVTCGGLTESPMSADEASRLARVFKALGDPARLRMASLIAAQPEVCVCDISPAFDLSPGTISHHLKQLREAGLVSSERRGTYVWYRINPEALGALSALLAVPTPA